GLLQPAKFHFDPPAHFVEARRCFGSQLLPFQDARQQPDLGLCLANRNLQQPQSQRWLVGTLSRSWPAQDEAVLTLLLEGAVSMLTQQADVGPDPYQKVSFLFEQACPQRVADKP